VASIFLSSAYKPFFSRVVVLTRNPASLKSLYFASLGAELRHIPEGTVAIKDALKSALRGVDVLINALNICAGMLSELLLESALNAGVRVYFPSGFGM